MELINAYYYSIQENVIGHYVFSPFDYRYRPGTHAGTAHGAWGGVLREKNAPTTLPHPGRPPATRCM